MTQPAAPGRANEEMVDRLIAEGALWSRRLIAAFRATPRHHFLDRVFLYQRRREAWRELITRDPGPEELRVVYSDRALITHLSPTARPGTGTPISSSSQPSLMAQMLEDLQLAPGLNTLEVGAGTGYNAALLAHVVGSGRVLAVDVDRGVLAEAWDHLRRFAERRVELRHADGRHGYPEAAPFDRIMVTAATRDLEPDWLDQLSAGGLLLAPLALAPGLAFVVCGTVRDGVFDGRLTRAAYFMPLRGEDEAGFSDTETPLAGEGARTLRAPWAGWFDRRRPRINWLGFVQSLACYGWLRGLAVHYRTRTTGQPEFGVSEPDGSAWCWLGADAWQVSGESGQALGRGLWGAFLEAGGPWPTEFRLRASPSGGLCAGGPEAYLRRGPRCQQLWELNEPRERPAWIF
jgi:protein-L-isoaspartate(D-aspartate) O-methyltransferase